MKKALISIGGKPFYYILTTYYSIVLLAIVVMFLSSCGVQEKIPVITESDGNKTINWYSTYVKKVIAKDKDNYYYSVAFEDGTTYYATFGEWSLINVNDFVEFKSKRMYKIVQVIKPGICGQ